MIGAEYKEELFVVNLGVFSENWSNANIIINCISSDLLRLIIGVLLAEFRAGNIRIPRFTNCLEPYERFGWQFWENVKVNHILM